MTKAITLKQNAVIQHDLLNVGKMVDERLEELNIENLVATDDTIRALKTLRTELNKELRDFEEQRKTIKNIVAKPYMDLEEVYKEEVSEKYNNALTILKDKIDEHEMRVKLEKQKVIESYFNEVRDYTGHSFLKYDDLDIKINLSTSIKKYREEVDEFVKRVDDDIKLIATQDHEAEILVEYKKDLNCSRAIQDVAERKAAEKYEAEKRKEQEHIRRVNRLTSLNFEFREFENAYVHTEHKELYVSWHDLDTRSQIEFDAIAADMERQIKAATTITAPVKIAPPQQESGAPKMLKARFEVEGTLEQLKALKECLINNNITYKNI